MYICTKCNHMSEQKKNFCALCGAPMAEAIPVAQPATQAPRAPQPPQPVAPPAPQPVIQPAARPAPKKSSSDRLGFVFAVIAAVISLLGLYSVWSGFWEGFATENFVDLPSNSMMSFFLSSPFALMGFIFSTESEKKDESTTLTRIGKILSAAGLVISVLLLILAFVSCIFVYA